MTNVHKLTALFTVRVFTRQTEYKCQQTNDSIKTADCISFTFVHHNLKNKPMNQHEMKSPVKKSKIRKNHSFID